MWCEMREGVLCKMRCESCRAKDATHKITVQDEKDNCLDIAYVCLDCLVVLTPHSGLKG